MEQTNSEKTIMSTGTNLHLKVLQKSNRIYCKPLLFTFAFERRKERNVLMQEQLNH